MIWVRLKENMRDRLNNISIGIFSVLFSICFILTFKVVFSGNITDNLLKNHFGQIGPIEILLMLVVAAAVFFLVNAVAVMLDSKKLHSFFSKEEKLDFKKVFKVNFIITFCVWILFFLTFYPIVGMNDSLWIIKQPLQMAGQHPILYNLFLSGCYHAGKLIFGSATAGLAFYSLMQMAIIDACISYCVAWFSSKNFPKIITYIIGLYFALMPIVADYAMTAIKDSIFSAIIMLYIPLLYETVESGGEFLKKKIGIIRFVLLGLSLCLIRNNGSYVLFGIAVVIFCMFKNLRKTIALLTCIVMLVGSVPNKIVERLGVKSLFQEAVAVPLQQIGMVVARDKITDKEDIDFIENMLPIREFRNNYSPMSVDTIKWDGNFNTDYLNEHPKDFLLFWCKQLVRHPLLYVEAYLLETYGFWSIGTQNSNQYVFFDITSTAQNMRLKAYLAKEGIRNHSVFPEFIQTNLVHMYRNLAQYAGAGNCLWISLLISLMLIVKRKQRYLLVLAPCAGVWLTLMISAPVAFAFRYVFMFVLCLPFLVFLPFLAQKNIN